MLDGLCVYWHLTKDSVERMFQPQTKGLFGTLYVQSNLILHWFITVGSRLVSTTTPVSYTHLDVYKRQPVCDSWNAFIKTSLSLSWPHGGRYLFFQKIIIRSTKCRNTYHRTIFNFIAAYNVFVSFSRYLKKLSMLIQNRNNNTSLYVHVYGHHLRS